MLVGRNAEIASIESLLAGAREHRSGVLVLRGEAGIGKSALLEQALAAADGFTVLRGIGIESEAELPYAGLHQILRPVLDGVDSLPAPQAEAIRAAFALTTETVDERFRVSLGVLGLLSDAAEEQPLLCIVDDAQWLDQPSADALLFVARRLEAEGIALLIGARDDDMRTPFGRGLPELRLSPLNHADARTLLADRLAAQATAAIVDWLLDSANGNPLALVELPGTLTLNQLAGRGPNVAGLPPATSVEEVYLDRVEALPEATRSLLLVAAAEETGALATVAAAARDLGLELGELGHAETAGLVRVDAGTLVFRHPLVRTAIYRSASFTARERAHRALAVASDAEGSSDRAAWHRAVATVGTDEHVAQELERTAERARLRSGHAAAASALARAAELSAEDDARARRLVAAASAAWQAGQPDTANALLNEARPLVVESSLLAEWNHVRGVIEWRCGSLPAACATLLEGAAKIAEVNPRKALELLADAGVAAWDAGDFARLEDVETAATALPELDGQHGLLRDVVVGGIGLSLGKTPAELEFVRTAIPRAAESDEPRVLTWGGIAAEVAGESASESAILGRAAASARASGAVDRLTVTLESVAVQGFLAGDYSVTAEATEGLRLAQDAGLPNAASLHRASLAWIAAVQGREEESRAQAQTVFDAARHNRHGISNAIAGWALALLDLGSGRADEAATRLLTLKDAPAGVGHRVYSLLFSPDMVEACVRAGRNDDAQDAFRLLDEFAKPGAPMWSHAYASRCRGLLADGDEADAEFVRALELHGEADNPFDRARTHLAYGEFLRRTRRRIDAREQLRLAFEAFERLQAAPWAERASTELRASGETARKREPSTLAELTPQELQIARLVAAGGSNKEVAAQLFLSPRTIDYHLRKVFQKLGIASRAELARHEAVLDQEREPALAAL